MTDNIRLIYNTNCKNAITSNRKYNFCGFCMDWLDKIKEIYLLIISFSMISLLIYIVYKKKKATEILSICAAFCTAALIPYIPNLSDFSINRSGFVAKMRYSIYEANASVEQMRNIAITIAHSTIGATALIDLENGEQETAINIGTEITKELRDLGVSEDTIRYTMQDYDNLMEYSLLKKIEHAYIDYCNKNNLNKQCNFNFSKFEDYPIAKENDIRKYLSENTSIGESVEKPLYELEYYQKYYKVHDKDYFKNTRQF